MLTNRALLQQLRPGGAMDCTVHNAAAEEGGIRSVDDGVDGELRDAGLHGLALHRFRAIFTTMSNSDFATG
jgi:hypothetical protein